MSRLETVQDELPSVGISDAWTLVREPVESVTAIGQGNRSRVYRITLREGGARVLRITPKGSGRVERERQVRAILNNDPRVPTVHEVLVRDHPLTASCDAVLMRELPGETLHAALHARPDATAISLWRQFGEGLASLHTREVPGFGLLDGRGRGMYSSWRDAMQAAAAQALRDARSTHLADLCDAASARLDALAPALDAVTAGRLLHGDPQPLNVLTLGERITAWIDFEYASAGDPLYELAFVASLFEHDATNPFRAHHLTWWCEAFADGYTARGCPPSDPDAASRTAFYRLLHALRGAEFLRVAALRLPAPVQAKITEALRAQIVARS